ncbi:hypothetical protein KM043_005228 [Ampulex compressa]|nr:hypothetical protein KM043_005228 [Ampulex compressa]
MPARRSSAVIHSLGVVWTSSTILSLTLTRLSATSPFGSSRRAREGGEGGRGRCKKRRPILGALTPGRQFYAGVGPLLKGQLAFCAQSSQVEAQLRHGTLGKTSKGLRPVAIYIRGAKMRYEAGDWHSYCSLELMFRDGGREENGEGRSACFVRVLDVNSPVRLDLQGTRP